MNKLFLTAAVVVALSGIFSVQAQDGFVVWAEGSNCNRELKFNKLTGGKLGPKLTAVNKGTGADIHVNISYDGVWIAFSRFIGTPSGPYDGPCDYHSSDKQDMYIAKIDNGNNLPATAIKVDHGYWASWAMDENAKDPSKPKTLYFNNFESKTIMKTIIQGDGTFSKPEKFASGPTPFHQTQMSPDGNYIAYRPSGLSIMQVSTRKDVSGAGGAGCHPCWGPRSKYIIWAQNKVCRIDDGKITMKATSAGLGSYWFGISNDVEYDKGKLWIIGRISGSGQNSAGPIQFKQVDISGGGWKVGSGTLVGNGTTADIHIFGSTGPVDVNPKAQLNPINIESSFNAKVTSSANGLELVISSHNMTGYSAGLYDLQGKQRASITLSALQDVMPLNNVATGRYVLKLSNNKVSAQKAVWISR